MNLIAHLLGLDSASSYWYTFWSGFGSDIGELAIVGGLVSIYRRHMCHVKPCWRVGRHSVSNTEWTVCRKHHPDPSPTHADVIAKWKEGQS